MRVGQTDSFMGLMAHHAWSSARVGCRVVLLFGFFIAFVSPSLRAATFNIPAGDVQSLIEAIMVANGNGQKDTINLATNATYALTDTHQSVDGSCGLPSIADDGPGNGIVINGNGSIIQRGPLPLSSMGIDPLPLLPPIIRPPPVHLSLFRILHVGDGGDVELNRVVIRNGMNLSRGAGILNRGQLMVNGCEVSDNLVMSISGVAGGNPAGGGIFNLGALVLNETMLVRNAAIAPPENRVGMDGADAHGGGIFNAAGGVAFVMNSCVASNSANGGSVAEGNNSVEGSGRGGGIYNEPGATLEVANSTIGFNRALGGNGGSRFRFGEITEGGGIYGGNGDATHGTNNPIRVINSTIAFNTAVEGTKPITIAGLRSQGGGILTSYGFTPFPQVPMVIRNTIVASNYAGSTPNFVGLAQESYPDARGIITSEGNNLIGIGAGLLGFAPQEDLVGTEETPIDPMLGPLSDNGGPTLTFALLSGSPAIDAGSTNTAELPPYDQRGPGFARISNARLDIGAFEKQIATAPMFTLCPDSVLVANDPGQCDALMVFSVAATGIPEPLVVCELNGEIIESPFAFPVGVNFITCTASNIAGVSTCEFAVVVVDTEPPVIADIKATPSVLWPPNHKLVNVTVTANTIENCGPAECRILEVISSEPETTSGKGHSAPDVVITGDLTVMLRAERTGKGLGRTYTIVVGCTDSSGNTSMETFTVIVPH